MPLKRDRHPDMNVNDLDYSISYQICQNFDIDRSWEPLAGVIGYSTNHIQIFELEIQRANGSPTKKLLWDWGTRGGTVRDLYDKLALINKTQSMRLLEHIVNQEKEKKTPESKVDNCVPDDASLRSKSDNCYSSDYSMFYDTDSLPIPTMKNCGAVVKETNTVDVNFNMPDRRIEKTGNKPPMFDKSFGMILEPHGASSLELFGQADGPGSTKGNMGAASSAARSFERVRSVVEEHGSEAVNMSGWSENEVQIARALVSTPSYSYKELSAATAGFSVNNKLGQGKFGAVYYGLVKNTRCAVKKLKQTTEVMNDEENSALHLAGELKALSRYRHENIVSMYGYTFDNDEVCLVYQYMTNGSLYHCLHRKPNLLLSWEQRLYILRGAACGLQFLHSIDKKPVIHGDIKSANILLDNYFEAKIGDLGMAKQATGGENTGHMTHITRKNTSVQDYRNKAYHPPEIARGNGFSVKGDSYSFGVVIFECLSGQEAYDERREGSIEHKYLVEYIQSALDDSPKLQKQKTFQDPKLKIEFPAATFNVLFELAQRCTEEKKKDRPTVIEVYIGIDRCENDHSVPDYQNMPEITKEKGNRGEAGSIHEHHMSVRKQSSFTPGLHAPPGVNPDLSVPESPIDLLPKDQPLPVAFKLQQELDEQKKQQTETEHVYVNQISEQIKTTYVSDPNKLKNIAKFDKENFRHGQQLENTEKISSLDNFRHGQPFENTEKISSSDNFRHGQPFENTEKISSLDNFRHGQPFENTEKISSLDKTRIEDDSFPYMLAADLTNMDRNIADETDRNMAALDKADHFEKELDEIACKALKGDSSMMNIFTTFEKNVKDEHLIDVSQIDMVEENGEFDIQFDFEANDSETSTITESINNDNEHLSGDFNDDALFASDSPVSYVNLQEKVSNENIDASLEEHQKKLSMYQGMNWEHHERSAQPDGHDTTHTSLPAQAHCHGNHNNQTGEGVQSLPTHSQDHCNDVCENNTNVCGPAGSNQESGDYSNAAAMFGNIPNEGNCTGKIMNIQDLLQRREPSEGHCEEYV